MQWILENINTLLFDTVSVKLKAEYESLKFFCKSLVTSKYFLNPLSYLSYISREFKFEFLVNRFFKRISVVIYFL